MTATDMNDELVLGYLLSPNGGSSSSTAPMSMVRLDEILAIKHWYTNSGTFWYPQMITPKAVFWTESFSDYTKVCRHLGLPDPRSDTITEGHYADMWKRFIAQDGTPPKP